ncbi:GalNAc-alpha-(1,4)-GalNAc-alpha-(1,3)-diNAcBac-PP-undecaprenol alpha-1,4-N-acetyl-D-galactosaminyltransferase [Campylobacter porcelli]|uniref:GalNAc-alpha-(1,4)-GalNAc-alpha-(1, 3)-diNAcBac-PP-undecaprenol alpha-1,4-N-acetyl-D-galactosaminyltransferase n=2 Tax=Campylobacteraceae TaxID=72294 RepID=A0A1X9SUT0_9BACT|nr:GalNAc-alpha-(1,4)-GalNAc-alpha-(1,3)-diNAcBac-PP-undecaprenol alpha-1,4-N-acetyl-D-galactosaminyltransferase [Campylobacter sp. RM6137]
MKIMLVISALRNGGAERVVELLSCELGKNHQIETIYFEENLNLYKISGKLTHLNIYENRSYLSKFSKFLKIRAYVKKSNPDIIISFMDQTNINLIISTIFLKPKIIATEHVSYNLLKSRIWRKIRDISYRFCDALVVLSKVDKEYYNFVKNCKIIYNPLYLKAQNSIKKEKLILSVGRLEPVKGYDLYLEALALIDKNLLNGYKIIIAGDGSERKKLELKAKNLGLDIEFLGHISKIEELYQRAEILVLPSLSEAFGNVLNEAGAYGVVRISTPTAGALEILRDNIDALIAKDFSPKALSNSIIRAIKDENLRENLVKNINLDRFSSQSIVLKWEELIKELKGK